MMIIKVSSPSSSSRTSGVLFYRQNNTQRSRSNIFPPYPRALVQIRTARKVSRLDSRSAPLRSFSFYSTFERVLPRARVIDHQICFRERLVVNHFFWRCFYIQCAYSDRCTWWEKWCAKSKFFSYLISISLYYCTNFVPFSLFKRTPTSGR